MFGHISHGVEVQLAPLFLEGAKGDGLADARDRTLGTRTFRPDGGCKSSTVSGISRSGYMAMRASGSPFFRHVTTSVFVSAGARSNPAGSAGNGLDNSGGRASRSS